MVSDRTLQRVFGLDPRFVAMWGTPIRALTVLITCLVLAGLTGAYVNTVRNTIEIRQGQDFGLFYRSAGSTQPASALPSPNLNPPHFSYLLRPFTRVELPRAFLAWLAMSVIALLISVAVIVRTAELRWGAVVAVCVFLYAASPTVATLLTGQVGLVLLLPFTIGWASARQHRYVSAGAWIGICASVKPFFLLFVPFLVARRQIGAAFVALAPVVVVFGIGVAYDGIDAYRVWIDDLLSVTWAEHYLNASALGFVERTLSASEWQQVPVVHAPKMVAPVWVTLCVGISVATLWRVRSIPSVDAQFLLVTSAALLLSPLGWIYYLLVPHPPGCRRDFHVYDSRTASGVARAGACWIPDAAVSSPGRTTVVLRVGDGDLRVRLLLVAGRPLGCRPAGAPPNGVGGYGDGAGTGTHSASLTVTRNESRLVDDLSSAAGSPVTPPSRRRVGFAAATLGTATATPGPLSDKRHRQFI